MRPLRYLAATVLFLVAVCSEPSALTIKLGSIAPPGSPWDEGLKKLANEWSEISNGQVSLKIYTGGVLGDEPDMVRKMRIGQLDAAGIVGSGLREIYSGVSAAWLPLSIRSEGEFKYVFDKMKPFFEEELEKRGFKVVMWIQVGWTYFFSRKPVLTPDDLRRQKLWVWSAEPAEIQAWKEAGFHVVSLPTTEVMVGLQSGMIDAVIASPLAAAFYQWFGVIPNMTDMRIAPIFGAVVISVKSWDRIPSDMRPQLLQAAQRASLSMAGASIRTEGDAVNIMKTYGLSVHPISPATKEEWNAMMRRFHRLGTLLDREAYEKVKFYLDEFHKNDVN